MKHFLVLLIFVFSTNSFAKRTLLCNGDSSQLEVVSPGNSFRVEGFYRYNKNSSGSFGSIAALGCDYLSEIKSDVLDCMEYYYLIIFSKFIVPTNVFSSSSNQKSTVIELKRNENTGEIEDSFLFENCVVFDAKE